MTLTDEAHGMFEKYRLLEEYLNEQKDTKGIKLMFELLESTSIVIKTLIEYNNEIIRTINEMEEVK